MDGGVFPDDFDPLLEEGGTANDDVLHDGSERHLEGVYHDTRYYDICLVQRSAVIVTSVRVTIIYREGLS